MGRAASEGPDSFLHQDIGPDSRAVAADADLPCPHAARAAGLLVIADAKRGDIGTTMEAYAATWLGIGSPLESDAVTVSPYLGVDSLAGTFDMADRNSKGVFVLAATSNPEAAALQRSRVESGEYLAADVVNRVSARSTFFSIIGLVSASNLVRISAVAASHFACFSSKVLNR